MKSRSAALVVSVMAAATLVSGATAFSAGPTPTKLSKGQLAQVNGIFKASTDLKHADPIVNLHLQCTQTACVATGPHSEKKFSWLLGTSPPITLRRIALDKLPAPAAYADWDELRVNDRGNPLSVASSYGVPARPQPSSPIVAAWDYQSEPRKLRQFEACTPHTVGPTDDKTAPWFKCSDLGVRDDIGQWTTAAGEEIDSSDYVVGHGLSPKSQTTPDGAKETVTKEASAGYAKVAQVIRTCVIRQHRAVVLSADHTLTAVAWQSGVGHCPKIPVDGVIDYQFLGAQLVSWTWDMHKAK